MSFLVSGDAYGAFMGRFSEPLAQELAAYAEVVEGQRVLDVGCGPGALTAVLVDRVGAANVTAADPSEPFVEALRARLPEVEVHVAPAEHLPFEDETYDVVLAQLVVHFMTDPVAGLREMARVARPGGLVGACVWDSAGGTSPLSTFWRAVTDLDPGVDDETGFNGAREGHLLELFAQAGLTDLRPTRLSVHVPLAGLEEWWHPYTLGVGPAGDYVARLDDTRRDALKQRCAELLPEGPFTVTGSAWTVVGRA